MLVSSKPHFRPVKTLAACATEAPIARPGLGEDVVDHRLHLLAPPPPQVLHLILLHPEENRAQGQQPGGVGQHAHAVRG